MLNFDANGHLPGAGEQGVVGLAVDQTNGDVFASMVYASVAFSNTAPRYGEVIRLQSLDGGRSAVTQTVVLDLAGEPQSLTHQISSRQGAALQPGWQRAQRQSVLQRRRWDRPGRLPTFCASGMSRRFICRRPFAKDNCSRLLG